MCIGRRPISRLIERVNSGRLRMSLTYSPRGRWVDFIEADGKIIAGCKLDDLFDEDGNRFEEDI